MARNFRRYRTSHPIADLNVTNLIDLGFMLLVIFMVATPLIQQEQTIQVNLPTESKRPQQPNDKDTFQSISIDRSGAYFFGSARTDWAELRDRLEELARRPKPPVIRIRADLGLQWQQVVKLMDEIKKHDLTRITFDTQTVD
jgi:biopolymer transport protein ExbD